MQIPNEAVIRAYDQYVAAHPDARESLVQLGWFFIGWQHGARDAEATGKAAVRALAVVRDVWTLSLDGFCEKYGDMTQRERVAFVNRTIRDVLATDIARAWISEGQNG